MLVFDVGPRMTIKDTLKACRALGISATWFAATNEFMLDYRRGDPRYASGRLRAYFTSDRDDAVATAELMSEWGKA